jgi:hypothetical protein
VEFGYRDSQKHEMMISPLDTMQWRSQKYTVYLEVIILLRARINLAVVILRPVQ